jgi:uncharacterized protein YjbI with pentapeptide repeats
LGCPVRRDNKENTMKIEIKNRWNGSVLFSVEATSMKEAVEVAVKSGSDLSDSDLRGSNLSGSDLKGSDLRGSDLKGSDLSDSDLRGSDLRGSDLRGSDLSGSDLRDSDLRGSDLSDSNLSGSNLSDSNLSDSNLSGSNLSGSDLSDSNLRGSNLRPIRDDLWAILCSAPSEVVGLRQALLDGKVDGSTYEGDCACLVGTLAKVKGCPYTEIPGLAPKSSRPAERFFAAIKPGDTPDTSQFSKLTVEWVDEWLKKMHDAFVTIKA